MKVILTQDMESLGLGGEIVNVAKGYARNYLIPRGMALEATEQNIKLTEMQRKNIEIKRIKAKEDALKVKERLSGVSVTIAQKVGEESTEVVIAATQGNVSDLAEESADLLYHLLVLWADCRLTPAKVWAALAKREGVSGRAPKVRPEDD